MGWNFPRIVTLAVALTIGLSASWQRSSGAVISIDLSSEWIKVALVKPGVPMEIVLNKESKRKTAAVVAFKDGERLFGDPALAVAVKKPKSVYWYLQLLVGVHYDNPIVEQYRKWFPYYNIQKDEERGTVVFHHDSETSYTPEELLGMLLNHCKEFAEHYAGQSIRDVIITVPVFFNQAQRRGVSHAAQLVGLNVLQLMSDSSAVGLNYGLFRQSSFNASTLYTMFFDMGSTSTIVSIVEYKMARVKEGGMLNTHPQLTVKGVGFDRTLGGLEMDVRLRDHLAKQFESQRKSSSSVYNSPRALSKLLKEAKRVKTVLSANSDCLVQVESLMEDEDFHSKVSRTDFEELVDDLFDRIAAPVQQALMMAEITMGEIDSVVLVGGGTRVPRVQATLLSVVDKSELGKSLNTDEAAALGAVYQGASFTKLFRIKKFIIKDVCAYPVQVSFNKTTINSEGQSLMKTATRTLFSAGNPYPQKKVLTFNRHTSDFSFNVFYGDTSFLTDAEESYLGVKNLTMIGLEGVANALAENQYGGTKGIKVHFNLDESGILNLVSAESLFEYPDEEEVEPSTFSKISDTISSFFGGGDEKGEQGTGNDTDNKAPPKSSQQDKGIEGEDQATPSPSPPAENAETPTEGSPNGKESIEPLETETATEPEVDTKPQDAADTAGAGGEDVGNDSDEEESQTGQEAPETVDSTQQAGETSEEVVVTETTSTVESSVDEATQTPSASPKAKSAPASDSDVKMKVVKVNLTTSITQLDLPDPTLVQTEVSTQKLAELQQKDEDKKENDKAKNSLESYVFENLELMETEMVIAASQTEEREKIVASLRETYAWLEEDGYEAETKEYTLRLRELKRSSRAIFRRVDEAFRRPKYIEALKQSLNLSSDFLIRVKNISEDLQVFTDVELDTLEKLVDETTQWLLEKETAQNATAPFEEPVMLCADIEEKSKKVDREVLYLLNKLRSYPKPKPKAKKPASNTTNTTDSAKSHSADDSTIVPPTILEGETDKGDSEPSAAEETPMDSSIPLGADPELPGEEPIIENGFQQTDSKSHHEL